MAIGRVLQAEILDSLPPDDPDARRSRRDLVLLNALMGNAAWLRSRMDFVIAERIAEIGAGEGVVCKKMAAWLPDCEIIGLDRIPPPTDLPAKIGWRQGDLFQELPKCEAGVVVGVMILHHFTAEQLRDLGCILQKARAVYFCEPWRSGLARFWSACLSPFVGRVTRHDMPASINAGFRKGELAPLLGLENWRVEETTDLRGTIRLRAWKE